MKKILALAIILALVCSFAACGGSGGETPVASGESGNTQASGGDTGTAKESLQSGSEFSEVSLINNDQISVTIKEYNPNADYGPEFTLFFENKTEFSLNFTLDGAAINGYMIFTNMYTDVAAGASAYDTVSWNPVVLEDSGINYIESFSGVISVIDPSDLSKGVLYDDYFEVEVNGGGSGEAVKERTFSGAIAEQTLVSDGGILIVAKDYVVDQNGDASIIVYIENNTGKTITAFSDNESVNGTMCDMYFGENVLAGKKCYGSIDIDASDLAENHIETVNKVELTLKVGDSDALDITDTVVAINIA